MMDASMSAVAWGATLAAASIGACLRADESRYKAWPIAAATILSIKGGAWWSLPISTVLAAFLQKLRSGIGSSTRWKTVQVVLNQYRDQVFGGAAKTDPQHYHRVTIFKYVRWRFAAVLWPWSGWLVPVARSGVTRKSRINCFRASLDNPSLAEGIGGQAFSGMKTLAINDLPDLTVPQANADDIKRYAARTFLSEKRVSKKTLTARSLVGIPLEVKGKPWGCIVLDSHHPAQIPIRENVYSVLAKVLEELLQ